MEVDNPAYFESVGGYDYYERSLGRQRADEDCLDGKCRTICKYYAF